MISVDIAREMVRMREHLACMRVARALIEIRQPQVAEYAFDDGIGVHLCYPNYCLDTRTPLRIDVQPYNEVARTMTTRGAADMLRESAT